MSEMYSGLHVGQRFTSLEDFKTVIRSISVRQHWELRVMRSNKKSVVLGCRSSANCYFRVVCRANKNATYITSLQDSHSCRRNAASPGETPARSEASHVRFLLSEIPKLFDMTKKIRGQEVVDAVKRYHGYDIHMRQAQRALRKLQPKQRRTVADEASSNDADEEEQQIPPQPHTEQQDGGVAYNGLPDARWMPENLQSALIENGSIHQNEPPRNLPAPPPLPPQQHHAQPARHPPPVQQQQQQQQAPLTRNAQPINIPQLTFARPAPTQPPAPQQAPKPQRQPPQQAGHPAAPQLVLTNFKIEFTCTTCGSLNQSFFPNQGNVTGGNYIPHPMPNQNSVPRNVGPSAQNGASSNSTVDVEEDDGYDGAPTSNSRDMQSPWTPGALEVPIASANP